MVDAAAGRDDRDVPGRQLPGRDHQRAPGRRAQPAVLEPPHRQCGVRGEELLANWFGWMNRTLEATAEPEGVPWLWRQYAYRGYLTLQALDRAVLERRLPAAIFYNLLISARKPVSLA